MVTLGLCKKWAETDLETWRFDDKIDRFIVFSPAYSPCWQVSLSALIAYRKRSQIQYTNTTELSTACHLASSQRMKFFLLIAIFLTV
jgi:hypothetical protein